MKDSTITVTGKYNSAVIYTDRVDDGSMEQIQSMCDFLPLAGSQIRIMSDVHMGTGCTIGTTMTVHDRVIPAMVGVDIGCGMHTVMLQADHIDYAALDDFIRRNIPAGKGARQEVHPYWQQLDLRELKCYKHLHVDRVARCLGSLGGGNHFIEVDRDEDGQFYLVIHSGSRSLGGEVADYYQHAAFARLAGADADAFSRRFAVVTLDDSFGKWAGKTIHVPYEKAYLEGDLMQDYLHDMAITQRYAALNRQAMADDIVRGLDLGKWEEMETVHNYIDIPNGILRKGAVSARKGERLLLPLNMRDGALLCVGKGNPQWNQSAPHGAGRLYSRGKSKEVLSMDEYRRQMQGIYSTSISPATLDESPMAYKSIYDILHNIRPTVTVERRLLPTYNFKAGGK